MRSIRTVLIAMVAALAVTVSASGPAQASPEAQRGKVYRALVEQGMPAEMATALTSDPSVQLTLDGDQVLIDGEDLAEAQDEADLAMTNAIISAAKGSDYWYGLAINSLNQLKTVVYLRYSWSWMWWLRDHWDYITMLTSAACAFLPSTLAKACGALVAAWYWPLKSLISSGLSQKKCIRLRFPAPPLTDVSLWQRALVTCRI